ncbi:MAG TPA: hypothetical protein PLR78_02155, partial [Polaromonas sp.]|uniref:hypothetical protein n=1 Tax=Polaromonas sp. TaxID=1869339 RepID=UPI002BA84B4D
WGCFPRISPLLNQVGLWQFSAGFSIDQAQETQNRRELFGAASVFFTRLHCLLRRTVAIARLRAHSEFKRVSRLPPGSRRSGGFSTRFQPCGTFSEEGVSL